MIGLANTKLGNALIATLAALGLAAINAQAQPPEEFYKGRTISILLFTTAGSIYDTYARLLARLLPKHVPGGPAVVVKYMPGAGGLQAARYLAEVAPRDGTTIGGLSRTLIFEPLLGKNVAQVDYLKFGWLGSMSQSTAIYVSWKLTSKVRTAADLFDHELLIAGTGAAAETTIITTAINGILGTRIKLVQGYAGSVAGLLALERGEVDGGFDAFGRPYVTPPGLPDDRLKLLQDGFAASVEDPELIAETAKLKIPVALTSAAELESIVRDTYATPLEVVERVRRFMPKD